MSRYAVMEHGSIIKRGPLKVENEKG
jgi:hypothetical protein